MANRDDRKNTQKEEKLQGGVHKELVNEIMSLTDEEVQLVTHLLVSSQIIPPREQHVQCLRPYH